MTVGWFFFLSQNRYRKWSKNIVTVLWQLRGWYENFVVVPLWLIKGQASVAWKLITLSRVTNPMLMCMSVCNFKTTDQHFHIRLGQNWVCYHVLLAQFEQETTSGRCFFFFFGLMLAQWSSFMKNGQIFHYAPLMTCDLMVIQGGLMLL